MNTQFNEITIRVEDLDAGSLAVDKAFEVLTNPNVKAVVVAKIKGEDGNFVALGVMSSEMTFIYLEPVVAGGLAMALESLGLLSNVAKAMFAAGLDLATEIPAEPEKRWVAEIKVVDTHGEEYNTVASIDEVDELQEIIESGPAWGPGYTADIKLSYAA